uniref:Uncharacterized protein n=1 Tax=Rhizophora mucronata TaxID=61149 RepID=A0A2P2QJF6_RHIMU
MYQIASEKSITVYDVVLIKRRFVCGNMVYC